VSAAADELPKNPLLKCEGNLTILLSKPTVDSLTPRKFETIFRLKPLLAEHELGRNAHVFREILLTFPDFDSGFEDLLGRLGL
jgi:hypothetical protein